MKKTKLNEIIFKRVIENIKLDLEKLGFVFRKGKRRFEKIDKEYLHSIEFDNDYDIFLDSSLAGDHELYLSFKIRFWSEMPEFSKWYIINFKPKYATVITPFLRTLQFGLPLKEGEDYIVPDDFSSNSSTIISDSQEFKKVTENNFYSVSNYGREELIADFNSYRGRIFDTIEDQTLKPYDLVQFVEEADQDLRHIGLMIYIGRKDVASVIINRFIEKIRNKLNDEPTEIQRKEFEEALIYWDQLYEKHITA